MYYRACLDASLLLRPSPTNLYLCPILDLDHQRPYLVPLARQEHALDSHPALSKPRKVQGERHMTLVLDDLLQPPKRVHRALVPSLVPLAVRALEPTAPTGPPALGEQPPVGSAQIHLGVIPAKDAVEMVFRESGRGGFGCPRSEFGLGQRVLV